MQENIKTPSPKGRLITSSTILTGKAAIVVTICVIAVSYGLFFYLQGVIEANVKESIFNQNKENQVQSTKAMAQHIESDLDSITERLALIASNPTYRSGDLHSERARLELIKAFDQINTITTEAELTTQPAITASNNEMPSAIAKNTKFGDLYLVDSSGMVTIDASAPSQESDMEGKVLPDIVMGTIDTGVPLLSKGYKGSDGLFRIAATYPIFRGTEDDDNSNNANQQEEQEIVGLVVQTMTTKVFFEHYGNIYDIQSQYIAVLDSDSLQLAHPLNSFIGTRFFDEYTQNVTGHNEVLNNLIRKVMSGTPTTDIYQFVNGERLNSGYPIYFNGKPVYFVFIITPTSVIYSSIDALLFAQRVETFALIAGTTTAIGILIFSLARWNSSLDKVVRARTAEIAKSNEQLQRVNSQLEESNRQLSFANERLIEMNEQLKKSETIQREFIDVAAHELRTPIQPIVGLAEMMKGRTADPQMHKLIDVIQRNAKRLQLLSSNILDVARLESETLPIKRVEIDLKQLIESVIEEFKSLVGERLSLKLSFDSNGTKDSNNRVKILADRERIIQVLSNLIVNAIKFTKNGEIKLTVSQMDQQAIVTIRDTGTGIDPNVTSKLFSKFVTTSEKGTGLGLFISKKIVESHGGKIWAENNKDGKGATFAFSLPIVSQRQTNLVRDTDIDTDIDIARGV